MNPFAFIIAIAVIVLLMPVFRAVLDECWASAFNAKNMGDRFLHWFVGLLLCFVFSGLALLAFALGSMPASSSTWLKL